ncbi:hypothetical protein IWX46DRAFT_585342 [Phyllosticta citricarpa]|uniref:Uncharacterized protein n=1 Tax=Phyllosticta citricarpa TaxID=55181 RepID=A0ABR1L754_9PEZI
MSTQSTRPTNIDKAVSMPPRSTWVSYSGTTHPSTAPDIRRRRTASREKGKPTLDHKSAEASRPIDAITVYVAHTPPPPPPPPPHPPPPSPPSRPLPHFPSPSPRA